jgi:hypothetical protein
MFVVDRRSALEDWYSLYSESCKIVKSKGWVKACREICLGSDWIQPGDL